jgi:serine/threonine protein kinase
VAQIQEWARVAGEEPIPGYRLVEPLGQGGFGEVWKCEVSGGLYKAIKFVRGPRTGPSGSPATQELAALQQVKALRHPFILSLERVEVIDDFLIIVMELADRGLNTLQAEQQANGLPGVPREELLGYLLEAAEALDWMNFTHDLQHLDIKPHNLFLVSNHIKVADFGLVHSLGDIDSGHAPQRHGGATPLYASPEILRGTLSRHSDQYSLAIVYQQMLTGTVPFWSNNPHQLMQLHLTAKPSLDALPEADQPLVARALAKAPEHRFPSCLDFVNALWTSAAAGTAAEGAFAPSSRRRSSSTNRRLTPSAVQDHQETQTPLPAGAPTPAEERASRGIEKTVPYEVPEGPAAASAVVSPPGPSAAPGGVAPTSVSLPGYRFLSCTSQSPFGDIWKVEDADGREARALCLHACSGQGEKVIARLQTLTHPGLPLTKVFWSPAERVVLVTAPFEKTLRDRFDACRAEGQPGMPRGELLKCLGTVAEALDFVFREHGLSHLNLSPRSIVLQPGGAQVADCGVVPLVWEPTGQPAGQLNPRYAAPELFGQHSSPTSDQYSLALIYAEMLSGVPPRPYRGPIAGPGSGLQRRVGRQLTPTGPRSSRKAPPRIDLDLVPVLDRAVLARALSERPGERFASCTELIQALAAAIPDTRATAELYRNLPVVIPFRSLLGEPATPGTVLPSVGQIVRALTATGTSQTVRGGTNVRYTIRPGGVWEYVFPTTAIPATIRLQVDGFRQHWNAQLVREEAGGLLLHLDLQLPRRFHERPTTRPPQLELQVHAPSMQGLGHRVGEARVRLRLLGGDPTLVNHVLPNLAPQLFDSIRSYLQARTEQRANERWPCVQPLSAYPVQPDLELGEVLEGSGRNISLTGVSFRATKRPTTEKLYLHWHRSSKVADYALLARVVRVQLVAGGLFEVAAIFPTARREPPPEADAAELWR